MSEIQYLEINDVTRIIKVPTNLLLGVMEDKDVERVYFKCKKIVGDNVDLSKHQLYVKYVNALDNSGKNFDVKTPGIYHCEDVVDHGDYITFSWLLSGNVFKKGGFVAFSVLASDGETTRWNTFPAIGTVLITIPGGLQEVEERYPDIITQLLNRMDEVEAMATPKAMQGYVNTYLAEHPAEIDPELLDPKKCAPADVVGQLKEEKISKPREEDNNKLAKAKNGEVEWIDVGQPTDQQTENAVTKWMDNHPEATTTVQDGAITEEKMNPVLQYNRKPNYYATLTTLVADKFVRVGTVAITLGFYKQCDGGGAKYIVRARTEEDIDGVGVVLLKNGLSAEMIIEHNEVTFEQLGAKCDDNTFDCKTYLLKYISLCDKLKKNKIKNWKWCVVLFTDAYL